MDAAIDIAQWMEKLISKLKGSFGKRLIFVGLQGSRARGEARKDSDIDAVVVVDNLSTEDLKLYKGIIGSMPESGLACGFIGSSEVLYAWPRHDAFNLVMDTHAYYGSLDFMNTEFTATDALNSAKAVASEIYHALAHTIVFESENLHDTFDACIKPTFFAMRALQFANTGNYPASRSEMRSLASDEEMLFLDAYEGTVDIDTEELAERLMDWSACIIAREEITSALKS